MIDRSHPLPLTRQVELVGISRGAVYYHPQAVSEADQLLMKRIDAVHLEHPNACSRMLRDMLNREGFEVGRRHVATLMQRMGIEALYRKPNTSQKHPGHKVYPYLLRGMPIERANQVWATDITYIPMACGWVYLCAIVDWASRKVLAQRVSISMDTAFCLEALEEAFAKYGQPEIFNTDQGSQFTSEAFTNALKERGIQISMDGKGGVARQRLRGAAVALDQVRGGVPACLRLGEPRQGQPGPLHRFLQRPTSALFAGHEDTRRVLLRDAAGDQTGSMSDEHELPTASVVRCVASAARPPPWTTLHRSSLPAGLHLSNAVRCADKRSHLCAERSVARPVKWTAKTRSQPSPNSTTPLPSEVCAMPSSWPARSPRFS